MAGVGEFLDRILNKQKRMQQYTYPEVKEEDKTLYNALMKYAKEHPEERDKFHNFDDFAEHFQKNIYNKPQMSAKIEKRDKSGNLIEEKTEVLKQATAEEMF